MNLPVCCLGNLYTSRATTIFPRVLLTVAATFWAGSCWYCSCLLACQIKTEILACTSTTCSRMSFPFWTTFQQSEARAETKAAFQLFWYKFSDVLRDLVPTTLLAGSWEAQSKATLWKLIVLCWFIIINVY